MTTPTLTYFDFAGGRGEDARLAFHIAGADWVDERVSGDWPQRKPNTPFGGLPTLEVPGEGTISQSNAILGYIGRKHGLLPTDPFECARHVAVMSAVEALRAQIATTDSNDAETKRAQREDFAQGYFARWAANMESQIRGPYVGGSELSVADLKLAVCLRAYPKGVFDHVPTNILDSHDKLIAQMAAVAAHPRVADWYASGAKGR